MALAPNATELQDIGAQPTSRALPRAAALLADLVLVAGTVGTTLRPEG
jgi:hypothetical protein